MFFCRDAGTVNVSLHHLPVVCWSTGGPHWVVLSGPEYLEEYTEEHNDLNRSLLLLRSLLVPHLTLGLVNHLKVVDDQNILREYHIRATNQTNMGSVHLSLWTI